MQLEKRESTGTGEKKLYTGIFTGIVRGINTTAEERGAIIGYDVKPNENGVIQQPVYEEKDTDGNEVVIVNFLLEGQDADKGKFFDARFRITDKEATNKDGSKFQYISATGDSSWADSETNLLEWFTHYQEETEKGSGVYKNIADKPYRKALRGECDLMNFMKAWLSKAKLTENGILINIKSLFRNVNKYVATEFVPEMSRPSDENVTDAVMCLATVYTKEKDGEIKHYQNLYKEYLPAYDGYTMKQVSAAVNSNNWNVVKMKSLKKWHKNLLGEYGPKDSWELCLLKPFDPTQHIAAGSETFRDDSTKGSQAEDTSY